MLISAADVLYGGLGRDEYRASVAPPHDVLAARTLRRADAGRIRCGDDDWTMIVRGHRADDFLVENHRFVGSPDQDATFDAGFVAPTFLMSEAASCDALASTSSSS